MFPFLPLKKCSRVIIIIIKHLSHNILWANVGGNIFTASHDENPFNSFTIATIKIISAYQTQIIINILVLT